MNETATSLYIPDPMDCRTCNLCTSHCPTFRVQGVFAESPQGRLKLIARVLHDGDDLSEEEAAALNHCVECRACEKVCPSKMPYLGLFEGTRARLPEPVRPLMVRMLCAVTRRQGRLRGTVSLLRALQRSGLLSLLDALGVFRLTRTEGLNALLPELKHHRALSEHYCAVNERRGAVALFTGCLTEAVHNDTLHAAVSLLTYLGYDVHVPARQHCCGAIHAHNGDQAAADELAELNLAAFGPLEVDAILYTASACGLPLGQYGQRNISAAAKAHAATFESRLMEINAFIARAEWPANVQLKSLDRQVFVHEPCSQQFPGATNKSPYESLKRIPGIRVEPLPDNTLCCGAGGSYMLTHPEMSQLIRAEKIRHLDGAAAGILLTSNIGCALHLQAGIREAGIDVEVTHPVALLARQLESGAVTLNP